MSKKSQDQDRAFFRILLLISELQEELDATDCDSFLAQCRRWYLHGQIDALQHYYANYVGRR